jgi:hypothetical protein
MSQCDDLPIRGNWSAPSPILCDEREVRLEQWNGRWHLWVRRGAEGAAQAAWLCLGIVGCRKTAVRLWLALIGAEQQR